MSQLVPLAVTSAQGATAAQSREGRLSLWQLASTKHRSKGWFGAGQLGFQTLDCSSMAISSQALDLDHCSMVSHVRAFLIGQASNYEASVSTFSSALKSSTQFFFFFNALVPVSSQTLASMLAWISLLDFQGLAKILFGLMGILDQCLLWSALARLVSTISSTGLTSVPQR